MNFPENFIAVMVEDHHRPHHHHDGDDDYGGSWINTTYSRLINVLCTTQYKILK